MVRFIKRVFVFIGGIQMAYQPFKLSEKERVRLNNALNELDAIEADLQRAQAANVPNVEALIANCAGKRECIEKIKATYAGNKK